MGFWSAQSLELYYQGIKTRCQCLVIEENSSCTLMLALFLGELDHFHPLLAPLTEILLKFGHAAFQSPRDYLQSLRICCSFQAAFPLKPESLPSGQAQVYSG